MSAERDAIVSDLIVKTCRPDPQPNVNKVLEWRSATQMDDFIWTTTGSLSELYIEPILKCIDDVDIMCFDNSRLAVWSRQEIPLHLPHIFKDAVELFEIVNVDNNAQLINYVFLRFIGLLIKQQQHQDAYCFTPSEVRMDMYYSDRMKEMFVIREGMEHHGPAAKTERAAMINNKYFASDYVSAVTCLSWPKQANEWRRRPRKALWPDSSTIERIVRNGCDLVNVAHQQHRHDTRQRNYQWRFSFSRAETILLNSWTPTQQIVYHILRVVLKDGGISELRNYSEYQMLSRYHIKTIMMWICEVKPSTWWNSLNIIRVSRWVMELLLRCCIAQHCPGYFVADSNLIECGVTQELISQLRLFTDLNYFTEWMINNYIRECIRVCPEDMQELFGDIATNRKLSVATDAVIKWRMQMTDEDNLSNMKFSILQMHVRNYDFNAHGVVRLCRAVEDIDGRLKSLFVSLIHLNSLLSLEGSTIPENDANILTATFLNCDNFMKMSSVETGVLLLRMSATASDSTTASILLTLSYFYMSRADRDSETIFSIYLAVLFYITGQYQTAIDYCRQTLLQSIPHHGEEKRRLTTIANNVDNMLGLAVIYQFIQSTKFGYSGTHSPCKKHFYK